MYIKLTYRTKSFSEAVSPTAGKEFPPLLWKPKFYVRVLKRELSDFILCQVNTVHNLTLCIFKIHFNIIVVSTLRFAKWHLPYSSSVENFVSISYLSNTAACSSHLFLVDLITLIIFSQAPHYTVFSSPSPNIPLSILLHTHCVWIYIILIPKMIL